MRVKIKRMLAAHLNHVTGGKKRDNRTAVNALLCEAIENHLRKNYTPASVKLYLDYLAAYKESKQDLLVEIKPKKKTEA